MAHPKRRKSHSRTLMGRAHHALIGVALVTCRNCGERARPHHACPKCGYYKAHKWHKPVLSIDVD